MLRVHFLLIAMASILPVVLSAPYNKTDPDPMPVSSAETGLAISNSTDVNLQADGFCEVVAAVTAALIQVPWENIGTFLSSEQTNCINNLVTPRGGSTQCGIRWASAMSGDCNCCWRSTYDSRPEDTKETMKNMIRANPWRKHKSAASSNLGSVIYEMNCIKGQSVDCTDDTSGWNGKITTKMS
ncbi:MAG: hypothetical protein J3R72DRAFT_530846 [Linnemannia gamsii]|nr:MAG: hypothetical protein J3R72DRAFT_530846 [Linnemannia gamsii]